MKFIFGILGFIIAIALFKLFRFKDLSFENPALAIVYVIGIAISFYAVYKDTQKSTK